MRIVCPTCETAYDAPDSVVAARKPVRCARCRTEWTPNDPADRALPQPPPEETERAVEPRPATAPGYQREPERTALRTPAVLPDEGEPYIHAPFPTLPEKADGLRPTVVAAWVASLLVLILAVWLCIAFRQPIMRHWPASARAFAALGFKKEPATSGVGR